MDKFDESIKDAEKPHKPSANFVETTMEQIDKQHVAHKTIRRKVLLSVLAGAVAAVAVIVGTALLANHANTPAKLAVSTGTAGSTSQDPSGGTSGTQTGPSDAILAHDLNSASQAMTQENNDQGAATTALNDNQQAITVPTN